MALSAAGVVTVGLIFLALVVFALYYMIKIATRSATGEQAKKSSKTTVAVLILVIAASMLITYPANATTQSYADNCRLAVHDIRESETSGGGTPGAGTYFEQVDRWE